MADMTSKKFQPTHAIVMKTYLRSIQQTMVFSMEEKLAKSRVSVTVVNMLKSMQ
jgi:hypothetical protein